MAKRKSSIEELFDALFDMTGFIWQVGAVVTAILILVSIRSFIWVSEVRTQDSAAATLIFEHFSWVLYAIPILIGFVAWLFALKTYQTYQTYQKR